MMPRGFFWVLPIVALGFSALAAAVEADTVPAKVCTADSGQDRAMCVTLIGAQRTMLNDGKTVCSPVAPDDLADTYAVMKWIRAHPGRQGDDLMAVTEEVLKTLHPCS